MRRLVALSALGFLIVVGVLMMRAARLTSKQIAVGPATPVALDRDALAARLAQAVRFQTVSQQDATNADGAQLLALHQLLREQFPLVHAQLKRETVNTYSLLYTWEGTEPQRPPLLLLSHLDVVPIEPGTETHWTQPPFEGRIADGFVWGRGTLDDKCGVLGALEAVEALLRQGVRPRASIYLAFGHDEELGGDHGARELAAVLQARGVRPELVLDEGGAVTQGLLPGIAGPVAVIGIAEKGSVSLELTAHVEGGHSSAPPPHTAVGILSAAIAALEQNQMPMHLGGPTRHFFEYVGAEMPLSYRMALANLWLFQPVLDRYLVAVPAINATLRTTTAATMISGGVKENVLPASARAVVNFRILPGDTVASVIEHARHAVNDPRVDVQPLAGEREPSAESPVDVPAFATLQRSISQVFPGVIVSPYLTIGGTDARHYAGLSANIYRFTPITGDSTTLARIHGTDERLGVADYERSVRFYIQLIQNAAL